MLPHHEGKELTKKDIRKCRNNKDFALLTIEELSQILKLTKSSIYTRIARREIPFIKMGRLVRFDKEEIWKWLDGQRIDKC